ncbi:MULTISPECIES: RICIN domain-containing protein [Kitasatospora]|uniref:Ricin B lectin domain-containing protein n=1 Tax=Kitasatospora cystarginea TaxID=58350 RepID=A0ABN3EZZ4_9ACTN
MHQPALMAAKAVAYLTVVPGMLLIATVGHPDTVTTAPSRPAPGPIGMYSGPLESWGPGPLGAPDIPPVTAATMTAVAPYRGLGTLDVWESAQRMDALGAKVSSAAEGTVVGTREKPGENSQEWILQPQQDGEFTVRSLLSGGTSGPLVLTAEPDGLVDLRSDRSQTGEEVSAQLWRFAERMPVIRLDPVARRPAMRFRIRAHQGGCLVAAPAGGPLSVGDCASAGTWWSDRGLHARTAV